MDNFGQSLTKITQTGAGFSNVSEMVLKSPLARFCNPLENRGGDQQFTDLPLQLTGLLLSPTQREKLSPDTA